MIKDASVCRIMVCCALMLCGRFLEFVSQVYGWIVYKINKLAPKREKKPFHFVSVVASFFILQWDSGINPFLALRLALGYFVFL